MPLNKNYIKHIGSLILNTLYHYLSKISCLKTKKPYKPTTKKELKELIKVESIYLGDIDTSLITDMSELFMGSNRITFNGINKWDVSKVTNMSKMFKECYTFNISLTFDTSNVIDMSEMFYRCCNFNKPLKLNTKKVKNMSYMFYHCFNFNQPLDFDTSNVVNMNAMFYRCSKFNKKLNFDIKNVTDMKNMFYGCEEFNQRLNFDTSNVVNMNAMFYGCKHFNQPLDFDTKNVTDMSYMLSGCKKFNKPIIFNTNKVTDINYILYDCKSFNQSLYFTSLYKADTIIINNKNNLRIKNLPHLKDFVINNFYHIKGIPKHIISQNWIKKVNNKYQPQNKAELKALVYTDGISLASIDTSLISDMSYLFENSNRKDFTGISKWDINGVKKAVNVFYKCHKLTDFMHLNKKEFKDITNSFSHHKHFMHEFQTAINSYDNHIFKPIKLSIKNKIILFLLATALFILVLEFNFLLVILVGFLALVGIAALFITI